MSFVKFKNPKIKFKIIAPCTSLHVCCFLNVKCGKFTKISLKNAMCIFWHLTVIVTVGTVIGCSAKTKFCQMAPKSTENH